MSFDHPPTGTFAAGPSSSRLALRRSPSAKSPSPMTMAKSPVSLDAERSPSIFSPTQTLLHDPSAMEAGFSAPAKENVEIMSNAPETVTQGAWEAVDTRSTSVSEAAGTAAPMNSPSSSSSFRSLSSTKRHEGFLDQETSSQHSSSNGPSEEGLGEFDKSQSTLTPFDPDTKEIRRLRRKVDLRLMPLLSIIYLCSYLDRSNVGNSKVYNIERDLNVSDSTFTWALSIFYIAYILGEVPSSLLLKKVGPSRWISMVIVLWGTVMMSMAALKDGAGLLVARFFLGLFESGFTPAPVFMISLWYTRIEQALRISIFFSAATVAGACAGLLAYAIATLDGVLGLKAWSWIFLIEGGITVLVAFIAYFVLPDWPETAKFLTERERQLTADRLRYDAGPATQTHFSWKQFRMVYKDPKTYMYAGVLFLHSPEFSSLGLFVPSIVHGFNFDPVTTQLMTVPIWTVACIMTLLCSLSSDRLMDRGGHAAACSAIALLGYLLLIFIPEDYLLGRYLSLMLCACGVFAVVPVLLAWPATNVGGHTKRGVTIATVISLAQIGAALGSKVYRDDDAPRYVRGHTICAILMTADLIAILVLRWYLKRLNAKRRALSTEEYRRACQGEDLCDDHPDFRFMA